MNVIRNLKNGNASGFDTIFNEMLKNSQEFIRDLLHKFVNLCLRQALVPNSWCLEIINPIFKYGNLHDPNNYRGISISSGLLKVLCTLLNNRIQSYCTKLDLINKNEIWFKSNQRTSDPLTNIKICS